MASTTTAVHLPWGAWYAEDAHELPLPGAWDVCVCPPVDLPAAEPDDISRAIRAPVDALPLVELAKNCQSACIAVDDLARPTRVAALLTPILSEFERAGLSLRAVSVVVATGSHGVLDPAQIERKLEGALPKEVRLECHDACKSTAPSGIRLGDRELMVNRTFLEAELKLAVGCVLPHSFAGFSGGAKLVLPGLSDIQGTVRTHRFVQMGLRGGKDPNQNGFRREAEDVVRRLGLNFVVCAVTNSRRETAAVFAGDLVSAHRRACEVAARAYATPVPGDCDCLVLNAYPKDVDLIQAENAFVALKTADRPLVREAGILLLTTAASEGLGRHGLFEPGGASYQSPRPRRALGGRELWLYAPNVSTGDARKLYWEGYPIFQRRDELVQALEQRLPGAARALVLPCAPMQQVRFVPSQPEGEGAQ